MTRRPLDWYALSREAAPGVLLGTEATGSPTERSVPTPSSHAADLMVGFEPDSPTSRPGTPCIALVEDGRASELFAWLHTYSVESFPVSQYCRIETTRDWDSLLRIQSPGSAFPGAAWASVVAGEMLANGEQSLELKAVPLSWAAGCFSYTMARVFCVGAGKQDDWPKQAASRLRTLEGDGRFVRRRLNIDMLAPIWSILAGGELTRNEDIRDVVAIVLSALDSEGAVLIRDNARLVSSSAEQRIHGFDELVDQVLTRRPRHGDSGRAPIQAGALIAAAALVAGGGTSHIDLLKPYSVEVPDCLPWFGLFAGLTGPRAWDPDWLRLVKGVERQVRSGFQLTDPLQGDLCWIEFDWLRQLSKSATVFIDLQKYHNRLLTVEILPGATFQVRLGVPQQQEARMPQRANTNEDSAPINTSNTRRAGGTTVNSDLLTRLDAISAQLSALVGEASGNLASSTEDGQRPLFGGSTGKVAKRQGNRGKKGVPDN